MTRVLLKIASLLLLGGSSIFAQASKISKDLQKADPHATVDVIIQFNQVADDKQHKKVKDKGGLHKASFNLIKSGLYTVPVNALNALANEIGRASCRERV